MDTQGINARIKAFDNLHGNVVVDGGFLLFEDGAAREVNPLGRLMGPPTDSLQLATRIARYWKVKLDLAVEEFDHYRQHHLTAAKIAVGQQAVPAPLEQKEKILAHLKELQKKVRHCQKQLEKAEAQVQEHQPQRIQQMAEQNEAFRLEAENLITEIQSIEL